METEEASGGDAKKLTPSSSVASYTEETHQRDPNQALHDHASTTMHVSADEHPLDDPGEASKYSKHAGNDKDDSVERSAHLSSPSSGREVKEDERKQEIDDGSSSSAEKNTNIILGARESEDYIDDIAGTRDLERNTSGTFSARDAEAVESRPKRATEHDPIGETRRRTSHSKEDGVMTHTLDKQLDRAHTGQRNNGNEGEQSHRSINSKGNSNDDENGSSSSDDGGTDTEDSDSGNLDSTRPEMIHGERRLRAHNSKSLLSQTTAQELTGEAEAGGGVQTPPRQRSPLFPKEQASLPVDRKRALVSRQEQAYSLSTGPRVGPTKMTRKDAALSSETSMMAMATPAPEVNTPFGAADTQEILERLERARVKTELPSAKVLNETEVAVLFKVDPTVDECKEEIDNLVQLCKRLQDEVETLKLVRREGEWKEEAWDMERAAVREKLRLKDDEIRLGREREDSLQEELRNVREELHQTLHEAELKAISGATQKGNSIEKALASPGESLEKMAVDTIEHWKCKVQALEHELKEAHKIQQEAETATEEEKDRSRKWLEQASSWEMEAQRLARYSQGLYNNLTTKRDEKRSFELKIGALEDELRDKARDVIFFGRRLEAMQNDNAVLRRQLDDRESKQNAARQEWRDQACRMRREYERLVQRNIEMAEQGRRERARMESSIEGAKEALLVTQKQHDELAKKHAALQSDCEALRRVERELETSLDEAKSEVIAMRREAMREGQEHREAMQKAEAEYFVTQNKLESEIKARVKWEEEVQQLKRDHRKQTGKVESLLVSLTKMKEDFATEHAERNRLLIEKARADGKHREHMGALKRSRKDFEEKFKKEREANKSLSLRLADVEADLQASRELLREKREELVRRGFSESHGEDVKRLKARLAAKVKECEALQQRVVELQSQIEDQKMLQNMLKTARMDAEKNKRLSLMMRRNTKSNMSAMLAELNSGVGVGDEDSGLPSAPSGVRRRTSGSPRLRKVSNSAGKALSLAMGKAKKGGGPKKKYQEHSREQGVVL